MKNNNTNMYPKCRLIANKTVYEIYMMLIHDSHPLKIYKAVMRIFSNERFSRNFSNSQKITTTTGTSYVNFIGLKNLRVETIHSTKYSLIHLICIHPCDLLTHKMSLYHYLF